MKAKYGIIKHTPASAKPVDRSVGIAAAMSYLNKREKLSDSDITRGCQDILKQRAS